MPMTRVELFQDLDQDHLVPDTDAVADDLSLELDASSLFSRATMLFSDKNLIGILTKSASWLLRNLE